MKFLHNIATVMLLGMASVAMGAQEQGRLAKPGWTKPAPTTTIRPETKPMIYKIDKPVTSYVTAGDYSDVDEYADYNGGSARRWWLPGASSQNTGVVGPRSLNTHY